MLYRIDNGYGQAILPEVQEPSITSRIPKQEKTGREGICHLYPFSSFYHG